MILATALALVAAPLGAQTGVITGLVTDEMSREPLSGAQVRLSGATIGAVTAENGRYRLVGVPAGTHTLEVRRLGYASTERTGIVVGANATVEIDVVLRRSSLMLDQVVVTGVVDPTAGVKVPFSVGRVSAEDLPVPSVNAVESIQGKIAGVTVIAGAQPGSGTNILLRSPTSITKSNFPLLVVDGVILSTAFGASSADLDALDIESVEVIKGAAAASMYGSRAANGVIQIRTARGSHLPEGITRLTLRSEYGRSSLARKVRWARYHPYRLNEQGEWLDDQGNVTSRENRALLPPATRFQDQRYPGPIHNPVDEFFHPADFSNQSLTIAQNAGRTNFLATIAGNNSGGLILDNGGYRRNDVRVNLDHRLREQLSISVSGYHMRSTRDELPQDAFFDLIHQAPDVNPRQPDPDGTPFIFQPDPIGRRANPLYLVFTEDETSMRARTLGSGDVRYAPLPWLSFDGNASYDRSDRNRRFFIDRGLKTEGEPDGGVGRLERVTGITNALNASASMNLLGSFDRLTMRATLRALMEREDNSVLTVTGTNLRVGGVPDFGNAASITSTSVAQDVRADGYFANFGLDYDGMYILDGLVRRDGSSLFGPDERWHTYYRISGAWRMAREAWWPLRSIGEFKLRASRGTAGGRPSFADQYETYTIRSDGSIVKDILGNTALKPERATETEVGLDVIALDRLSLQLSHARTEVVDQLLQVPLTAVLGYQFQWQNAGTVTGRSYEATVEYSLIETPRSRLRLGLVADRSRHRVTEFNRPCYSTATIGFRCAGETLGAMYGQKFVTSAGELPSAHAQSAGAFQRNDDGLLVPVGEGASWRDGLWGTTVTIDGVSYAWGIPIRLKTGSGADSVLRIGDGNADLHLGLSTQYRWRGLSIYGLLDSQIGGNVYNRAKQRMYQYYRSGDVDQADKPLERRKPVEYYDALYNGNNVVSWFVEDQTFVKLRELSVTYRFGRGMPLLRHLGTEGLQVGLIGRNLFVSTRYSGYDPEVGSTLTRIDGFEYPHFRTITGVIQVEF